MKLIREGILTEYEIKEKSNNLFIEGVFAVYDTLNENTRIYEGEVMKKAVDVYNKDFVEKKRSMGELGHPDNATINLDKVCLWVQEPLVFTENKEVHGRAKILKDHPMGQIAYNLLKEGITLGISTRGLGDLEETILEENGEKKEAYKVKDYVLIAPDLVAEPSSGRFIKGIMEGREYDYIDGEIIEKTEKIYREPKTARKMKVEDLIKIFEFITRGIK